MAGNIDTPSLWRLRTTGNSIPYKFLGADGSFTMDGGDITYKVIIPANQLIAFIGEIFPPATVFGNVAVPQGAARLPGLPNLRAKKVSFKAQDEGLPVDPFGFDSGAPANTYQNACELEINYGPSQVQDSKPTDPFTFLEISSAASAEVLHTTAPKGKLVGRNNPDMGGAFQENNAIVNPNNNALINPRIAAEPVEPNKDPVLPISLIVPTTEWTIKWNQIPFEFFRDILIYRLRFLMGRVNFGYFPLLFNADPETLLFTGYTYTNQYTWRDGQANVPPVNLEIKITEKRVVRAGVIYGHNDVWNPTKGKYERLLIDGTNPMFANWDFMELFSIGSDP